MAHRSQRTSGSDQKLYDMNFFSFSHQNFIVDSSFQSANTLQLVRKEDVIKTKSSDYCIVVS